MRIVDVEERRLPITISIKTKLLRFIDEECKRKAYTRSEYFNLLIETIIRLGGEDNDKDKA